MERLWLERAVSADRIEGLDMHMEYLQRDIEDLNDARGGGYLSRAFFRGQGLGHRLQGGSHGRRVLLG